MSSFEDFAPAPSFGDFGAAPHKERSKLLADIAGVLDMPLSVPAMAAQVIGETGGRIGTAAAGATRKEAAVEGAKVGEEFARPLQNPMRRVFDYFGLTEKSAPSDVDAAMSKLSQWMDKGAGWVEKKTGGAVLKEDVEVLSNAVMAGGLPEVGKFALGKVKAKPEEAPKPGAPLHPADNAMTAKQHIEEALGIKGTKEREAALKKRRAEVRAAFREDPDYADYLKYLAQERVDREAAYKKESGVSPHIQSEAEIESLSSMFHGVLDNPKQVYQALASHLAQSQAQPLATWFSVLEHSRVLGSPEYEALAPLVAVLKTSPALRGVKVAYDPAKIAQYEHAWGIEEGQHILGLYLHNSHSIALGRYGGSPLTMLHEATHAATIWKYTTDTKFASKVNGLLMEANKVASASGKEFYGLTNGKEFLAEAMSNPAFQAFLSTVQVGEKTALQHFKDMLRDMYYALAKSAGIARDKLGSTTALDHALDLVLEAAKDPAFTRSKGGVAPKVGAVLEDMPLEDQTALQRARERLQGGPEERARKFEEARRASKKLRQKQEGAADPKLLARMAAFGVGVGAGAYLDQQTPVEGAILGTLGAVVGTKAAPRVVEGIKTLRTPGKSVPISGLENAYDYIIQKGGLEAVAAQHTLEQMVPKAERRVAINRWIEGDRSIVLSPKEREAAQYFRTVMDGLAQDEMKAGVLTEEAVWQNYTTHLWDLRSTEKRGLFEQALQKKYGPNMAPGLRFAKARAFSTIAEGKAHGLPPLTEDISTILGIRMNASARAIANTHLIGALKAGKTPAGEVLAKKSFAAPANYVAIHHPQLEGLRVHPEIAASLRTYFEAGDPGTAMRALDAVNTTIKRLEVSFALFHAKSLTDAYVGATRGLLPVRIAKAVKQVGQAAAPRWLGENEFIKEIKEKGVQEGSLVDMALKGGLQFQLGDVASVKELDAGFYGGLQDVQDFLNKTIPMSGLPLEVVKKINHEVDGFTWGRLHAGMKLSIFAEKHKELLRNNAEAHAKDPSVSLLSKEQVASIAADFTNSVFGGLNWRRIAEGVKSKFGRELALSLVTPKAQAATRLLLFAPDWTVATTRSLVNAYGKGTGVRGLVKPQTLADLHRQYLLRSATYYLIAADGINYAMTGHNIWDNKDWTKVELGRGAWMRWSKHTTDPFEMMMHPGQWAINKMAYLPREALAQALNKEYLSATGAMPPMKEGRVLHAARGMSPFAVQNFRGGGVSGMLGVPIYRPPTLAERLADERARRDAAIKKRIEDIVNKSLATP